MAEERTEAKNKLHDCSGVDRLSSLPESILRYILSLLPTTKDVVMTAVLSKSWQFRWNSVPTLVFSFPDDEEDFSPDDFAHSVQNTLILHSAPVITKFGISCPFLESLKFRMNCWLRFAVGRRVGHITLDLYDVMVKYPLPAFLYTHRDLTKLTTTHCIISPPEMVHLPLLTDLSLREAQLSDAALAKLLSGCPSLKSLELSFCEGLSHPKIHSASLKRLTITTYCSWPYDSLEVITPKLESISFSGDWCLGHNQLITASSVVEVEFEFPWGYSLLNVAETHRLMRRTFKQRLRGFPNLEKLTLRKRLPATGISIVFGQIIAAGKAFWRSQVKKSPFTCLHHKLKRVEITGFGPNYRGWEFIDPLVEFLVSNARVLEKMTIRVHADGGYKPLITDLASEEVLKYFKAAQHMISYKRASPSAMVLFEY